MTSQTQDVKSKAASFPEQPGVYLMKDARNEVIYVGKAKNLRARVLSYFSPSGLEARLIETNFSQVADIDFVVTGNDKEALLLESNFIKQFKPKYNVVFRDDKSFVSIAVNMREDWPRPVITRRLGQEGTLYFGPYASAKNARAMLRTVKDIFPLRRCSLRECLGRSRPCLYAEMGKCSSPCAGNVTEEQYREILNQVVMFLKGNTDELIERLEAEMREAVERLAFEVAAKMRDRIGAVKDSFERRCLVSSGEHSDRDVFGLVVLDEALYISLLAIRGGNLQEVAHYKIPANVEDTPSAVESFLTQFYTAQTFIPVEILLPLEIPERELLAELLSERRGRRVQILCPVRGEQRRLVELANLNARNSLKVAMSEQESAERSLNSLRDVLDLDAPPRRIECFDISNLGGSLAVGSMAVFIDARPAKAEYRRYRIKTVAGQDDFAMIHEVIARRLLRGKDEKNLPDLIIIDGGRGQLSAAMHAARQSGLSDLRFAALAKERVRGGRKIRLERVFLPGKAEPRMLAPSSLAFQLLTAIRDEAHRFAVAYHRKLRSQPLKQGALARIPGIGPSLRKALMKRFGNVQAVREASMEELESVPGIGRARAVEIRKYFETERRAGAQ